MVHGNQAQITVDRDLDSAIFASALREAEYIRKCVTIDGAINMVPVLDLGKDAFVRPYFSVYASIGLDVAALLVKGHDRQRALEYVQLSDSFYSWYVSHMNPDGSIDDFTKGTLATPKPSGDADSEDAYAGIFLYGAYVHLKVTQQIDQKTAEGFLKRVEPHLRKAANLIVSLQAHDGLTIAKKNYPIQYLMDNLEAYAGLIALQRLGLSGFEQYAGRIATAVNRNLWLEKKYYAWARDPRNGVTSSGWIKWYPDKLANTWATYFSFIPPERKAVLYSALKAEFSDPASAYSTLGPEVVYLAVASLAQRDTPTADGYMREILKHQDQEGGFRDLHGYTHISGWFITAAGLRLAWNDLAEIIFT